MKLFISFLAAVVFGFVGFGLEATAQSPESGTPESRPESRSTIAPVSLDHLGTIEGVERNKETEFNSVFSDLRFRILGYEYGSERQSAFEDIRKVLEKYRAGLVKMADYEGQIEGYLRESVIPQFFQNEAAIELRLRASDKEFEEEYADALVRAQKLTKRANEAADHVLLVIEKARMRIKAAESMAELCALWRDAVLDNEDEREFIKAKVKKLRELLFPAATTVAAKPK